MGDISTIGICLELLEGNHMRRNQLGTSDIYISVLTLGCMSLGTDLQNASKMIDTALDAGVNHLDTADLYDFGKNEEIVGKAIKHKRDQIILTSKVGNHFDAAKKDWFWDPSEQHIKNGVKESLSRLETDYIDFYMLHGGTIDDPLDESIAAMEDLKQEGLIRAYGVSSIRPNVIRKYIQHSNIDAVMMQYSMLDRRPEEELLDELNQHQISVLSRGPLAKGMVSNHALKQIKQKAEKGYLDYTYDDLLTIYETLHNMATENNSSLQAYALKYVLNHPAVVSAVFGASSIDQIKENARIDLSEELSTETYHKLQQITKPITYKAHR